MTGPSPAAPDLVRLLLDQGRDNAVILLDPDGRVVGWLSGAEYILGYTAAEMIGQPITSIFTPDDLARGAAAHELAVARADGRAEDDRWHVRKDGTRIWASGVVIPLRDAAGELRGFGKVFRDRTDVKGQLQTLAHAADRHRAFLGTLAHELRGPLGAVVNAAALLRLTASPDAAQTLGIIDRQVAVLRRLADDLLEAVRCGTGTVRVELRPLKLEDVLTAAAAACRPLAEARRQDFRVLLLPSSTTVRADPERLHQVVVNLLGNAIKYTPPGGRVWLKATVEGGEAVVRVQDTGVGIAADMLPKVFDLFTQEPASAPLAAGGLGLGLPLVKDLVTRHGGTVQVRSDGRDKGSEFTVRLPLSPAAGS